MASGEEIAEQYEAVLGEALQVAESCDDDDWAKATAADGRTVGVLFDHIAVGNQEVVRWVESFLAGRPVEITRESLDAGNAEHARQVAQKPRAETVAELRRSGRRAAEFLRGLSERQLAVRGDFAWAGEKDAEWVASAAYRHPRGHLQAIREALGR